MGVLALLIVSASANGAVRKVPQKYSTIQAAVDAANPGDSIEISKKRNFEHVTVNTPRLVIKGVKKGVVVDGHIEGLGNGEQFDINANRVRLVNLELRHGYGVECNTSNRCVIDKVRFTGRSNDDCFSSAGDRAQVLNSRLTACGDSGIDISGNRAQVINTQVRQADNGCIYISGDDAVVRGTVARGCEDGSAIAINGNRALVRGNTVAVADGYLVEISGNQARVVKNKGGRAYYRCIEVSGDRGRVQGNRMSACQDGGVDINGQNPKAINNRFSGGSDYGVDISCAIACGKTVVQGNVVRDMFDDGEGIYVYVDSGRAVIRDNLVVGTSNGGFYLSLSQARIIGNVARANGFEQEDGLYVSGDGNLVRGNRAIGNGGAGIYVGGGSNRLERNVTRKNHGDGIYVSSYPDNKLIANVATKNKANGFHNDGVDTVLRRNRASGNRRDCANDGSIAAKQKNRCADKSNFNKAGVVTRARAKKRR